MTTRTIEVEVTETEEEQVHICDYCGREAAGENATAFYPTMDGQVLGSAMAAKLADLRASKEGGQIAIIDTKRDPIHYHEDCLPHATISEDDPVYEWSDLVDETGSKVRVVMATGEVAVSLLGLLCLGVAATVAVGFGVFILGVFGFVFLVSGIIAGIQQARTPTEYLTLEADE